VAQEEGIQAQAPQDAQKDTLAAEKVAFTGQLLWDILDEYLVDLSRHCRVWIQ
jgi:hypothetical protein